MEYQVKVQGKDTIEKLQIRHIKGMGMVEKLVEKESASQGAEFDDDEDFDQKLRNDLDNDDEFAGLVWQVGMDQQVSSEADGGKNDTESKRQ